MILVFGASGHIGGPLARFVATSSPGTPLRLVTSSREKVKSLRSELPQADVMVASYLDAHSLTAALDGVEGMFVVTPDFIDEERAMSNLADAARAAGSLRHAVRIVGLPPNASFEVPAGIEHPGPAIQHRRAVSTLRDGGVPLTVLNSMGYFMDDLLIHFSGPLKRDRTLVVPYERRMCFTHPAELGEVAARILLAGPEAHAGEVRHFNSGEDPIPFRDVAALLGEVLGTQIAYDPSPERFLAEVGPALEQLTGDGGAAHGLLTDFRAEQEHQSAFFGSPLGEELLGRRPTSLREWMEANRDALLA
jgi:uncharacterized protein YbjT (DUF2867 family)